MTGDDGGRCAGAAAGVLLGAEPIASEAASYQRFRIDLEAIDPMRNARRWSKWTRHARDTRSFIFFAELRLRDPPSPGGSLGSTDSPSHSSHKVNLMSCRPRMEASRFAHAGCRFWAHGRCSASPEALPTDGVTNHQRPTAWMRCRMGTAAATICHFSLLVFSFMVCSRAFVCSQWQTPMQAMWENWCHAVSMRRMNSS
ncbi:hypothetical protein EDB80DRAFT_272235 [Ilyonectria destructans]|nr:hypothetical protein EDB80DRAFT_272235 [Ilyonectria destructans]